MAPLQSITVIDPLPWPRSTVREFALHELENGGQLALNLGWQPSAWIVPPETDREPNPPYGYVVSFIRFHE
jgi:putative alpha-1,2-mannosidase